VKVVDLTDLVVDARVIEHTLGSRRLTGIDVGHDADIPDLSEGYDTGHFFKDLLRTTVVSVFWLSYQR
jgi:hypothetical protein